MASKKNIPKAHPLSRSIPPPKSAPRPKKILFSFAYWRQKELFGLECNLVNTNWFISLLERFRALGAVDVDHLLTDRKLKSDLRFHEINWEIKNCPIIKEDFMNLIPICYQNEETEFYQFALSTGKGRVHGFFDESQIFQIVLLDPMHNLQPSQYTNHKVRETSILMNEFEKAEMKFDSVVHEMNKYCDRDCRVKLEFENILESRNSKKLFCLTEYLNPADIDSLLGIHGSLDNIVTTAFLGLLESKKKDI